MRESGGKSGRRRSDARDVITVFSGGTGKKIPTDKSWDFEYWWQFEILNHVHKHSEIEHNFLNLRAAIKTPPELHSWVVESAYKDEGVTGATFKRPGQRLGNCPG